eukprot:1295465-Alexandrium_andersonii.AAC.2
MAEEGEAEPALDGETLEAALLEAEAAALAEGRVGESVTPRAEAALPAGWWRDPDGGATPTFTG